MFTHCAGTRWSYPEFRVVDVKTAAGCVVHVSAKQCAEIRVAACADNNLWLNAEFCVFALADPFWLCAKCTQPLVMSGIPRSATYRHMLYRILSSFTYTQSLMLLACGGSCWFCKKFRLLEVQADNCRLCVEF
jgi:hypothetical protein